jgi:adenylate cyclase
MDVTITTTGNNTTVDIPDEHEDRRVRTSLSMVNKMPYGIADSLGSNDYLTMLDLVQELVGRPGEAIFAMFGSVQLPKARFPVASPNLLSKILHDGFIDMFQSQLNALDPDLGDTIPDALRRTFLKLNQNLHDSLFTNHRKMSHASILSTKMADPATLRSGASGIVLYIKEKTVYVANLAMLWLSYPERVWLRRSRRDMISMNVRNIPNMRGRRMYVCIPDRFGCRLVVSCGKKPTSYSSEQTSVH